VKNFKPLIFASFIQWIPLAILAVCLAGTVYLATQSNYRSSANDPQVQLATDARNALMVGATPQSLVATHQIDIAQSLAPYLVIYDADGNVVAASATLHGQPLALPSGVFASAKTMPMDMLTWMPEPGVRSAIVVMHYADGYVMSGRSLQLVEQRESGLDQDIAIACALTLVATFCGVFLTRWLAARFAPQP
jgi:hypothetical protein